MGGYQSLPWCPPIRKKQLGQKKEKNKRKKEGEKVALIKHLPHLLIGWKTFVTS